MVNIVIVNNEQCVVDTTNITCEGAHTTHNQHNQTTGRVSCYVRARRAARALHGTRHSTKAREEKREKSRRRE
uniref:Uncharacterized protein n=1 Tax=Siphoviridae sp. ctQ091 TaxID=2825490 RepID=A0A8S5NV60_9CAUD|nr:MAG TPA: hypothetical protein [Siphoviridae sp. ctQ091]